MLALSNSIFLNQKNKGAFMTNILPIENQENIQANNANSVDYQTKGFVEAGKVQGSEAAFNIQLENLYSEIILNSDIKEHSKTLNELEIESQRKIYTDKINLNNKRINEINDKYLPEAKNELKLAEDEYADFKRFPERYVKVEKDNFNLWFYGFLSLALAIFLYVFYTSVIYSALFRDITISKFTIFNSILNPRAIEEAFNKGIAAAIATMSAPFIFFAIGIIVDSIRSKSSNIKSKISYVLFLIFVFMVDALFAFHISERIHNSKAINTFGTFEPYKLSDAITDLNFWIIIVLGFVVYLIFGKIFSLFNDERRNKHLYHNFENSLKSKINEFKKRIFDYNLELEAIRNDNFKAESNLVELKDNNTKIFFSVSEVNKVLSEFTLGWIRYLKNSEFNESIVQKFYLNFNNFLIKKGLINNKS